MKNLKSILNRVKSGKTSVPKALEALGSLPFSDLGFAKIDNHRAVRRGFPEVVFGQGKSVAQIRAISRELVRHNKSLLVTRVGRNVYDAMRKDVNGLRYDEDAGIIYLARKARKKMGLILVVTAGTSDLKVAKEAAITAEVMGNRVRCLADVGVAGVHRLFSHMKLLRKASVIIVAAGMEGALASVVSGLVSRPVIAVPTSVGYGASFKGIAPLLTMLNSCSPGVAVVNIDNGFGAGYFAGMINR